MEGRKAICSYLLVLACLQSIQQISATRKAFLSSILGHRKSSDCDSAYGIISGNPAPFSASKFDPIAELLHMRRLLERGWSTFGSPSNGPLGGALSSPLGGALGGALSSPLSGPFSGGLSSPLGGSLGGASSSPFSGPLGGALSSPLGGALSSPLNGEGSPIGGPVNFPSVGSGLTNEEPNILHGSFSGLLHKSFSALN